MSPHSRSGAISLSFTVPAGVPLVIRGLVVAEDGAIARAEEKPVAERFEGAGVGALVYPGRCS